MAPTQAEENSNAAVPEEGCLGQEKTHLVNKRQGGVKQWGHAQSMKDLDKAIFRKALIEDLLAWKA